VKRFLLLALVFSVMVTTGPVLADSDFYVIAGGGATVGTKISSVPFIINTPGFYFFSRNLDHSGTEPAIFVNADNVTIDLMGFSLSHTGIGGLGMGIALGSNNVEIRNGT
jgi:hypothetical protein